MEGVLGSLGRLEITDGDAETGQEIQDAVLEHLAEEVEPARLQGICTFSLGLNLNGKINFS